MGRCMFEEVSTDQIKTYNQIVKWLPTLNEVQLENLTKQVKMALAFEKAHNDRLDRAHDRMIEAEIEQNLEDKYEACRLY